MGRRLNGPRAVLPPVLLAGVVVALTGCGSTTPGTASTPAGTATAATSASPSSPAPSATAYAFCAEFPPLGPNDMLPVEGWWNGSPADADGDVVQDPADWPEPVRSHPRVALVDTDTGEVLETWDRASCDNDTPFTYVPDEELPPGSVAVVDMDSGVVVDDFPHPTDAAG